MTLNPDDVTYLLEYAFRAEEALGDVLYDNTTGTPRDYLRLDDQTWDRLDRAYRSLKGDLTLPELRNLHDGRLDTVGADLRFVPVEEFAAIDERGAEPLVVVTGSDKRLRAAVAAGSLALVYGDGGAGKTTLLLDLACHFAAGAPWCELLQPVRPLTVAWIENEGPRPMMREKTAAKLAAWQGPPLDGRLKVLDEPWGEFTFRDPSQCAQLTTALDELAVDLIVAGPLGRIGMEGAGTSDEIRDFLAHVEAALRACQTRPALTVVHHENKAGTVSGAWEREPDTLVHVQGQGHGRTRVFWAKARWASDLHATTSHLLWAEGESFTIEEKPEVTEDTIANNLLAAVLEEPGGSWSKIRPLIKGNDGEKATVRDRLLAAGRIVNTATRDGYFNLWAAEDLVATRADLSTAPARPLFPTPGGAPEPSRATVPYVSRHGARNGTGEPRSQAYEHEPQRLQAIGDETGLA